ncbi:MAG: FHA domain-containing protein [Planctomycetes bacterium]|nr:FHA domain-containing protein [Planctomycetota bacterium]
MAQLQVLSGKRQGFVLDIEADEVVDVGNRKTAKLSIRDPWISWNHARITREGERFFLEDAGSSNGTWVNGEKVKRRELRANDVIYFGKTKVKFAVAGAAASAAAAPTPAPTTQAAPAAEQPWWDRALEGPPEGAEAGLLQVQLRDERRMREALERFLDVPRGTPLGDAAKAGQLEQRVRELERELAQARAQAPKADDGALEKLRREHASRVVELETRAQTAEAKAVDLEGRLKERSEQAKKEVARAREKLQAEIDELKRALEEARAAATAAASGDDALAAARERGDRLEQELEEARARALEAEKRTDDALQELRAQQAASTGESEIERLTKALEEARGEAEHWREEHRKVVQEIDEISMEQIEIEDELKRRIQELEAQLPG